MCFWLLAMLAFLPACWSDKSGTHRLIVGIGFGIITTTNRPGVDVRDSHILGGEIGPDGFGVGWMNRHRVAIDPLLASNAVVSVKANPFGLTIKNYPVNGDDTTVLNSKPREAKP